MDKNQLAIHIFNKHAQSYQEKYWDLSLYHDSFDLFCQNIKKQNAEILELACGPGNITDYLLSKRPDFQILGTDLAPNMIDLARKNNPDATFQLLDCRNIKTLNQKYEGIMCGFGLPYLSKEEAIQLIQDAADLLQPGGLLYLSTMEDDYNKSGLKGPSSGGPDQLYMYFHQADYLTAALEENHFQLLDVQRMVYPAGDGTEVTDLVLLAKQL
ncbi:MAG: class I SAM-dependent methyltransferase [Lewinellaceae bacterium]|nr:class I SAM-dependent methyltransferase [Lewinellaceae bacterium]